MSDVPKILLLEDDERFRTLLAQVLTEEGFAVTAAARGEAAVELAQSESFDVLVADIRMNGMSGLEALECAQKLQPGMGSVVVSGFASELDVARSEHLQVGAYLHKPFKMAELLKHIHLELAKKREGKKRFQKENFSRFLVDWLVTRLAQAVDDLGNPEGSLMEAAHRAEEICRRLGLDLEKRLAARWATVIEGIKVIPGEPLPELLFESDSPMPELSGILSILESTSTDREASEEIQAVDLALRSYLGNEAELRSGEFSAAITQAYQQLLQEQPQREKRPLELRFDPQLQDASSRRLISLSLALERIGDFGAAEKAYHKLCGEEVPQKERLEGFLGLARLAFLGEQNAKSRKAALSALNLAHQRGPNSLAYRGLEAALLLRKLGAKEAKKALTEVGHAAKRVSYSQGLAIVYCALKDAQRDKLDEGQLAPLAGVDSSGSLKPYLDFLIPFVFQALVRQKSKTLGAILYRLACDYTPRFRYWFDKDRCEVECRRAVAEVLSSAKVLPSAVAELLARDPDPTVKKVVRKLGDVRVEASNPVLKIYSFGPAELSSRGETLPEKRWKTQKVKYLFFFLASKWGKSLKVDTVIDVLWPSESAQATKSLYWANSQLRAILKEQTGLDAPLVRVKDALLLESKIARWHDFENFMEEYERGSELYKSDDKDGALHHFMKACKAYRGPYLDGCYLDFAVKLRQKCEEMAFSANCRSAVMCLEKSRDEEALEFATNAVEIAPYLEEARAAKMKAQIRLGQGPAAMRQFQEFEELLTKEYEQEPSTHLHELFLRAKLGYTEA